MLKVTMTRRQANKLFAEYGQAMRDLSASRRADLAARYAQILADRGVEIVSGGPRTKDELIMAIRDVRYPAELLDEMTHVLYHEPGSVWSACGYCDGADYVPRAPSNGGKCPGCGRVMSVREGAEQGQCNDCLNGFG